MSEAKSTLGNTTELGSPQEFAERYSYTALRFYMQAVAREILPNNRINICWRYPLPARKTVEVIYSEERKRARAFGTMKCGQGWICPLCSSYIAEQRRNELGRALENGRKSYIAFMITYTARHNANTRLKPMLDKMQKAFRYLKTGKVWTSIKDEFYLVGSIRATEITYGSSGWHPHYHELMIVDIDCIRDFYEGAISEYAEGLEAVMAPRWLRGLEREGLTAREDLALRVSTTNKDVKDYIAKYGKMPLESDFASQANEIARGTTKTARSGNFSVWELLFEAGHNANSKRLFLEFVAAVKGKSQLQWSRGLKQLLDIDTIRDEIAAEGIETDTDRLLASINIEGWKWIANRGFLGQLMTIAHTGDAEKLQSFIGRRLSEMPEETNLTRMLEDAHRNH